MKFFYFYLGLLCLGLVRIAVAAEGEGPGESVIVINELFATSEAEYVDDDGEAADWVEITNLGAEAVSLAGWHFTDDAEVQAKWTFPETTLAAGEFLVVYATGKDRVDPSMPLHTNFKLSDGGETLSLAMPDGKAGHLLEYPKQREGMSYGLSDAGDYRFFPAPTLGAVNGDDGVCYVADTKFSVDRGFYNEPIEVEITCATPDAVIRYTTDGNEPSAGTLFGGATGTIYDGPITIDKTTVLRAFASKKAFKSSNIDTQPYLFLDDVIRQSPNKEVPPGWPEGNVAGQRFDFGMDPEVIDDPEYADQMVASMEAIPSMSLVLDHDDLTDSRDGIYTHAREDGRAWERPGSLELLNPDGSSGFHINAGVRIRGGFSRDSGNAKHSFRLFFRSEYGDSRLNFPLFGDEGIQSFKKFDFRTAQNYAWSLASSNDGKRNTFLREIFARDSQRAMGQPYTRSRYYHLYLNGIYWGLFMSQERSTDDYAASYFGGEPEDYDVIKVEAGPYTIFATEGTIDAFDELHGLVAGEVSDAEFYALQGMTPDGEEDESLTKHIDVTNLIDYMMTIFYVGSFDAPLAGNDRANNFYAIRNREAREGWRFFCHDTEHSMLSTRENRMGPYPAGRSKQHFNPQFLHQQLMQSDAYRLAFADRVRREFFHDGVFTVEAARERWNARKAEIDLAIIAETARWGDQRGRLYTKVDWLEENRWALEDFMSGRTGTVFNQMDFVGLTGDLLTPEFSPQHGGVVEDPDTFKMKFKVGTLFNTQDGDIYYTLDGTDPKAPDGSVSPTAISYQRNGSGDALAGTARVRVRLTHESQWSPVNEATFVVGGSVASSENLVISEIMYHPQAPAPESAFQVESAYEFVELWNPSDEVVDLTGSSFVRGIRFVMPASQLEPGQRAVIVHTQAAFEERYGTEVPVIGAYGSESGGKLSNNGDRLELINIYGETIADFRYNDGGEWPMGADGSGYSLVRDESAGDPAIADTWRVSSDLLGSPGRESSPPSESGYTQWKQANGLSDDQADPDQDGLVHFMEYAVGGDPLEPNIDQPIEVSRLGAETLLISVLQADAAIDVEIVLESSDDLVTWNVLAEPVALESEAVSDSKTLLRWEVSSATTEAVAYRARYALK
ncbi:MAG: hypothetical protein GWQ08_07240 [Verrucomicrobiaceae bacterium]|nr:hypothetical protein [Verrucomicrobiaceae bacterium]